MSEKRSLGEYLSNEEIWLDPSYKIHSLGGEEIRSLDGMDIRGRKVEVRNRLKRGAEEHGVFQVSEPPAEEPRFGQCSVMIFFVIPRNADWRDCGSPPLETPVAPPGEKVFLTDSAIELIRHHPFKSEMPTQVDYLLELPIAC